MSAWQTLTVAQRELVGTTDKGYTGSEFPHVGTWSGARAALLGNLPFIGAGHFRRAYRDGAWVYKVVEGDECRNGCHGQSPSQEWQVSEYANLTAWRKSLHTMAAPTALWWVAGHGIIAQPYYPKDVNSSLRLMDEFDRFTRNLWMHNPLGLFDLHPGNFRGTAHDRLRLIDASEWF